MKGAEDGRGSDTAQVLGGAIARNPLGISQRSGVIVPIPILSGLHYQYLRI